MIVNQTGGGSAKESIEHFRGTLSVERSNDSESTAAILRLPFKADYTLIMTSGSYNYSFPLQYISSAFGVGNTSYVGNTSAYHYVALPEGNVTVVKGYNPNRRPFVIYIEAFKLKE